MSFNKDQSAVIYWGRRGGGLKLFNEFIEIANAENRNLLIFSRPKKKSKEYISFFNVFKWIHARKLLVGEIIHLDIKVVVIVMSSPWDLWLGRKLKIHGIEVVRVIHDGKPHVGEFFPTNFLIRWWTRDCSKIVTLSTHVANQLSTIHGVSSEKITVSDFPIPTVKMSEVSFRSGAKRVLLIGRGKKYQGQKFLEDAWALVESPGLELVIAGEGFRPISSDHTITYKCYWMSDEQIFKEIFLSDLVVFPYLEASQSGTVPICISLEIPVIVTPIGGLPEQVSNYSRGLVLENLTPECLAKTISTALTMTWPENSELKVDRRIALLEACLGRN
jgi:glycosyltransferase involved in cell wall biosynthesis